MLGCPARKVRFPKLCVRGVRTHPKPPSGYCYGPTNTLTSPWIELRDIRKDFWRVEPLTLIRTETISVWLVMVHSQSVLSKENVHRVREGVYLNAFSLQKQKGSVLTINISIINPLPDAKSLPTFLKKQEYSGHLIANIAMQWFLNGYGSLKSRRKKFGTQ